MLNIYNIIIIKNTNTNTNTKLYIYNNKQYI